MYACTCTPTHAHTHTLQHHTLTIVEAGGRKAARMSMNTYVTFAFASHVLILHLWASCAAAQWFRRSLGLRVFRDRGPAEGSPRRKNMGPTP